MQSLRTRQLRADLSFDGTTYTSSKKWAFPATTTLGGETLISSAHAHVDSYCYVNVNRAAETYTETGTELAPYRSLSAAITDKLTIDSVDYVIFKLAPGDYVGTILNVQNTPNQSFEIVGSGRDCTFIKGSAAWDATVGDVLRFENFLRCTFREITVLNGQYVCNVENCNFEYLGSSGFGHSFSTSDVDAAAYWDARGTAGAQRSDGGTMRIRNVRSENKRLSNNTV